MRNALVLALTLALMAPAFTQPQGEINQKAEDGFKKADIELNQVYQRLLSKLDPTSKKELVQAQQAWIKFRDANARARAGGFLGGSAYPGVYFGARGQTTRERVKDLKSWLEEFGN